jgi:two-component system sensor histidine kinase BaeS
MWRAGAFAIAALVVVVVLVVVIASAVSSVLGHVSNVVVGIGVMLATMLVLRGLIRGFRGSVEPAGDLVAAAARVEEGDYSQRVAERGPREVRRVVRAFNAMSARLEADETERRRLLADVSHELRTPLAVIQGNLEGMIDGLYPADAEHLATVLEETHVLERLVEDLRTLSLSEAGALRLHHEPTDVAALLADVVAGFAAAADAAGVRLSVRADDGLPVLDLDPDRTRQVIGNLLANALRHTPAGGSVTLRAASTAAGTRIAVEDTGRGIPPEALPHVFERFYRGPESRGSGLGLPIAQLLVRAQGGEITARSEPGQGTTVEITFPPPP